MNEKEIKKLIKTQIIPYLVGIRNDLQDKKQADGEEVEAIVFRGKPGEPGKTPVADKDYPSVATIEKFIKENLPKRGKDYFTAKDIREMVREVLRQMPPPKKGKDGIVDYTKTETIARKITLEKAKEIKAEVKFLSDQVFKAIDDSKSDKIKATEVRDLLESLEGSARLDAKAVKGLERFVQTLIVQSGGGGGGGGGSSTPPGSDTQVIFNDGGSYGADAGFTYNKTTDTATIANLTLTNPLLTTSGGTGLASWTQGDIPYYTSGTALSKLAKNTSATRYLSNTGTSNAPAWAQVSLSNGVSGTLPIGSGGTGATSFANTRIPYSNGTVLTSSSSLTYNGSVFTGPGGFTLTPFAGGTWLGMPTTGPSAMGPADSVGGETWIAYASSPGNYMTNSLTGDIIYRTGGRIMWGSGAESSGNSQMMLNDHWFGIGDGLVPLAPFHLRRPIATSASCTGDNSVPTCTGDNSSPNTCPDQMDEGSCNGTGGCSWNGLSCDGDNSVANTCPDQLDESSCNATMGCAWGTTTNTCPSQMNQGACEGAGCTWDLGNGFPTVTWDARWDYDASNYMSLVMSSTGSATFDLVGTSPVFTFSDPVTINGALTLSAQNIVTDTTTGMKIGTATSQKLGFFNATPVVQQANTTDLGTVLSNLGLRASGTAYPITTSGAVNFTGGLTIATTNLTITDKDIALSATTGTKIATATSQKLGFWNATPIVQPTTAVASATFVANTSANIMYQESTFDGYTVQQVVKALRNEGLLA